MVSSMRGNVGDDKGWDDKVISTAMECRDPEPDPTMNRIRRHEPHEIICQNTFHISVHIYEYMISLLIHSLI